MYLKCINIHSLIDFRYETFRNQRMCEPLVIPLDVMLMESPSQSPSSAQLQCINLGNKWIFNRPTTLLKDL